MAEENHHHHHHLPKMSDDTAKPTKSIVYRYTVPSSHTGRLLCTTILTLFLLLGVTALVLYLVYRPSSPKFTVIGAAVYSLSNTSTSLFSPQANVISSNMQFTISSHNPSARASIYYDHLSAYVSYRGQPITPPAPLPPIFQERESTVAVSPILGGGQVPVSPEVAEGLAADQEFGVVGLRLVLLGRVKYKTGPFRSAWTGLYVRCDMLLGIKKGMVGQVPTISSSECDVDV